MRFDADQHVDDSREVIGPGTYDLRVTKVEMASTKRGDGELIKVGFEILGPRFSGRWIWDQFLTRHPSPDAQRIGLGRLSELSRALRMPRWEHEQDLVGLTCEARVVVVEDGEYGPKNEIKRYTVPASHKGAPASNPHRDAPPSQRHQERSYGPANPPPYEPPIRAQSQYHDDVPF